MKKYQKTALVTGANSGIGLDTVEQLAKLGYEKIIIGARTLEKAAHTTKLLQEKGYGDIFASLAMDTSDVDSAKRAAEQIKRSGFRIDLLILNAGSVTAGLEKNKDGVDLTFASTLVGHHVLTMLLLENRILSDQSNIVIAGSEAARGDVPGMSLPDLDQISKEVYQNNMQATLEAFAKGYSVGEYNVMKAYSVAKLYVAWWASMLNEKLPEGIRVFAISPGSVPSTNFARHQSFLMRNVLLPLMSTVGRFMSAAGPVSSASERYISSVKMPDENSGKFYASPAGKMIGTLTEQKTAYLADGNMKFSAWNTIVKLSGGIDYNMEEESSISSFKEERQSA